MIFCLKVGWESGWWSVGLMDFACFALSCLPFCAVSDALFSGICSTFCFLLHLTYIFIQLMFLRILTYNSVDLWFTSFDIFKKIQAKSWLKVSLCMVKEWQGPRIGQMISRMPFIPLHSLRDFQRFVVSDLKR